MARLALLSVSNKTGVIDLARSLVEEFGFDIISSGGTAKPSKMQEYQLLKFLIIQVHQKF